MLCSTTVGGGRETLQEPLTRSLVKTTRENDCDKGLIHVSSIHFAAIVSALQPRQRMLFKFLIASINSNDARLKMGLTILNLL